MSRRTRHRKGHGIPLRTAWLILACLILVFAVIDVVAHLALLAAGAGIAVLARESGRRFERHRSPVIRRPVPPDPVTRIAR